MSIKTVPSVHATASGGPLRLNEVEQPNAAQGSHSADTLALERNTARAAAKATAGSGTNNKKMSTAVRLAGAVSGRVGLFRRMNPVTSNGFSDDIGSDLNAIKSLQPIPAGAPPWRRRLADKNEKKIKALEKKEMELKRKVTEENTSLYAL